VLVRNGGAKLNGVAETHDVDTSTFEELLDPTNELILYVAPEKFRGKPNK
jgi:hypothetical protein